MLGAAVSKLKSSFEVLKNENITTNTLAIGLVVCIAVYWWMTRSRYTLPPGPRGLPILGYLPFLSKEAYKDFERLGKEFGNVFGLYLGRKYVVVLGDYETSKEGLNHPPLLGRPGAQFDFAPDGGGFVSVNSTEWVEQRRYAVRAMRDIGLGGSKWEQLIQEEIDEVMKVIDKNSGQPADYAKVLSESMANNITTLVLGKRIPAGDRARKLVERTVELGIEVADVAALRNFFPAIADFLAKFGLISQSKDLHSTFAEYTEFLKKQVNERKKVYKNEDSDNFIDGYLKEIDNNLSNNLNNSFNERNLRGNILSLIAAGTDTTNSSLIWLLLAMAMFPDIQTKVQQELDSVLGKEGRAKYTERSKLPYTFAVLQEGGRWKTVVPLSVVRQNLEDTKFNGYDIPKDALIFPNLYAIHKNPKYWKEPEKFIPERFLSSEGLPITSKMDAYIPFSYGKRNCPGETVAKITIFMYFVAILQRYTVLPPVGKTPNMEAKPGITYRPVQQELRFVARE